MTPWLHDLLLASGDIALRHFRGEFEIITKSDGSPVTTADLAIHEHWKAELPKHEPETVLLSEEEKVADEVRLSARRAVILDPIDGTRLFIDGDEAFSVLAGIWEDGAIIEGACYYPVTGGLLWAKRGEGCWWNDSRVQVSTRSIQDARIRNWAGAFPERNTTDWDTRASCEFMRAVCCGELDGSIMATGGAWGEHDAAFVMPCIEEAGGTITDGEGKPLTFNQQDRTVAPYIVISNGGIHDELLAWL